jgi:hypothetical protein
MKVKMGGQKPQTQLRVKANRQRLHSLTDPLSLSLKG